MCRVFQQGIGGRVQCPGSQSSFGACQNLVLWPPAQHDQHAGGPPEGTLRRQRLFTQLALAWPRWLPCTYKKKQLARENDSIWLFGGSVLMRKVPRRSLPHIMPSEADRKTIAHHRLDDPGALFAELTIDRLLNWPVQGGGFSRSFLFKWPGAYYVSIHIKLLPPLQYYIQFIGSGLDFILWKSARSCIKA